MIKIRKALFAGAGLAVALAGCSTVRNAWRAQEEIAPKGTDAAAPAARLDLRDWSLERLVAFAMTNRPSVVSARLAVEDARLALREIAADAPIISETPWTAPHLSLSGGYSESSGGTHVGGGEGFRTSGTANFGLSLELLLYDFGRYDAQARGQAERVVAAEQALIDEGYTVFGEVAAAYFNFLEARSILKVSIDTRDDYAEQLARAEARLQAGEAQQLDVLRAKVDLADSIQEVVSSSNKVQTTAATFMHALGVDVARGTARDVLDLSPIPFGTVYRAFPETVYTTETAYDLARTNAPGMRVCRAKLRAASHDVDYAIANMLPKVTATATFSWVDPMWYWTWGVNAVQSVFEGFRKTAAVDRAVVAMRSAAADVDASEQQLSAELQSAVAVRDNAVEGLLASIASARSARENMEVVKAQFAVGDATRIDLSSAVAQYSSAIGSCLTAFYYGQRAEAALYAIVGSRPVFREQKLEKVEVIR